MKPGKWKWAIALVVAAAVIGAIFYFKLPSILQDLLKRVLDWIAGLGIRGAIVFGAIYVVACVLFVPASILTLGAGALFGVVKGSIVVSVSATVGATAAFLVGRYMARDWVARKIEGN